MKQVLVVDASATMQRMVMASLRVLKEISFHEAANGLRRSNDGAHAVVVVLD